MGDMGIGLGETGGVQPIKIDWGDGTGRFKVTVDGETKTYKINVKQDGDDITGEVMAQYRDQVMSTVGRLLQQASIDKPDDPDRKQFFEDLGGARIRTGGVFADPAGAAEDADIPAIRRDTGSEALKDRFQDFQDLSELLQQQAKTIDAKATETIAAGDLATATPTDGGAGGLADTHDVTTRAPPIAAGPDTVARAVLAEVEGLPTGTDEGAPVADAKAGDAAQVVAKHADEVAAPVLLPATNTDTAEVALEPAGAPPSLAAQHMEIHVRELADRALAEVKDAGPDELVGDEEGMDATPAEGPPTPTLEDHKRAMDANENGDFGAQVFAGDAFTAVAGTEDEGVDAKAPDVEGEDAGGDEVGDEKATKGPPTPTLEDQKRAMDAYGDGAVRARVLTGDAFTAAAGAGEEVGDDGTNKIPGGSPGELVEGAEVVGDDETNKIPGGSPGSMVVGIAGPVASDISSTESLPEGEVSTGSAEGGEPSLVDGGGEGSRLEKHSAGLRRLIKKQTGLKNQADIDTVVAYTKQVFSNGSAFVVLSDVEYRLSAEGQQTISRWGKAGAEGSDPAYSGVHGFQVLDRGNLLEVKFQGEVLGKGGGSTVFKTDSFVLGGPLLRASRSSSSSLSAVYKTTNNADDAADMRNDARLLEVLSGDPDAPPGIADPPVVRNFSYGDTVAAVAIQRRYQKQDAAVQLHSFSTRQRGRGIGRLATALAFCNNKGVVHCDLKLKNTFVDKEGEMVLGDFGLGIKKEDKDASIQYAARRQNQLTTSYVCPSDMQHTIAPGGEFEYYEKRDAFAFGMMAHELLTGLPGSAEGDQRGPFALTSVPADHPLARHKKTKMADVAGQPDWSRLETAVEEGEYPEGTADFVKALLDPDLNTRLTMQQAVAKYGDVIAALKT